MNDKINSYSGIRDSLKTGDIALCAGTDLIAAGIKSVTDSPYSHVVIVRQDIDRVMVLEAVREGVVYRPMSFLKAHDYEYISVYRVKPEGTFDVDAQIGALLDELGRGYAFAQVGKIWWAERLGLSFGLKDEVCLDGMICSGYASKGDRAGGQDPMPDKPDAFTYPGDFTKTDYREHVFSFRF